MLLVVWVFYNHCTGIGLLLECSVIKDGSNNLIVFAEFNLGWLEEEDLMRSIKLFGEQVIPRIRDFQPY